MLAKIVELISDNTTEFKYAFVFDLNASISIIREDFGIP